MKRLDGSFIRRRKRRQFTPEQKRALITQFGAEGGTALAFSRKHQLTYTAFLRWRKEAAAPSANLLPVQIIRPQSKPESSVMEVHLKCGRKISLTPGFDHSAVQQLIQVLEQMC